MALQNIVCLPRLDIHANDGVPGKGLVVFAWLEYSYYYFTSNSIASGKNQRRGYSVSKIKNGDL